MTETRTWVCPVKPTHLWHGLPLPYAECPGPFPDQPRRVVAERVPCARCATGFPIPHTCEKAPPHSWQIGRERHESQDESVRDDAGRQPPGGTFLVAPAGTTALEPEQWTEIGYMPEGLTFG